MPPEKRMLKTTPLQPPPWALPETQPLGQSLQHPPPQHPAAPEWMPCLGQPTFLSHMRNGGRRHRRRRNEHAHLPRARPTLSTPGSGHHPSVLLWQQPVPLRACQHCCETQGRGIGRQPGLQLPRARTLLKTLGGCISGTPGLAGAPFSLFPHPEARLKRTQQWTPGDHLTDVQPLQTPARGVLPNTLLSGGTGIRTTCAYATVYIPQLLDHELQMPAGAEQGRDTGSPPWGWPALAPEQESCRVTRPRPDRPAQPALEDRQLLAALSVTLREGPPLCHLRTTATQGSRQ